MKILIKISCIIMFFFCFSVAKAQQNPVMTHYTINPYLYNPAQVGENGYTTVNAHYRKQWINMPDAPDTKLLTAQGLINNKYGIGGKVFLDRAHIIQNFGAMFSYAYYVRTKKIPTQHYLSLGVSVGFKTQRLSFNEATIKDDLDPSIFYDGATSSVFDAEAGINYKLKGFRLAAFVSNIAPNNYNYRRDVSALEYQPTYHVYGTLGYDIALGKNKSFMIKPSALVRYIPNVPFQFDGNLLLDWKNKIWIGGGYRYKNAGVWGTAGFRVHDMVAFTYSYEQSIDGYQQALGSTHEMTMEFRFKAKDKDLAKEIEDKFDDMRQKMLVKNKELLDSLEGVQNEIDNLRTELNNSKDTINNFKESSTTVIHEGNKVKYASLGKVNFFLNSPVIHKQQAVEAEAIFEQLDLLEKEGKLIMIRIEGSASIEGSETYNLILSNKRSEAMKDYLLGKGVDGDKITISSKGNSEAMMRGNAYEDKDAATPNPEDRYVRVYVLYND